MIKLISPLLIFCISFSWLASPALAEEPQGEVTKYGVYAYWRAKERSWVNPISTSPIVHEGGKAFLTMDTTEIPIIKSLFFGFSYKLSGLPDGAVLLDWTVAHPEIRKPDGTLSTGYSYKRSVTVVDGIALGTSGYTFDEAYEMVEGEWQFTYSYQGKPLVSQKFLTVRHESKDQNSL